LLIETNGAARLPKGNLASRAILGGIVASVNGTISHCLQSQACKPFCLRAMMISGNKIIKPTLYMHTGVALGMVQKEWVFQ
jgi:hypothetical protein